MNEQQVSEQSLQESEFHGWLQHPTTQRLRALIRERKEALKEQWASGQFTDLSQYGAAILNAKAIGECQTLDWLLELEFTHLYEEMESGARDI